MDKVYIIAVVASSILIAVVVVVLVLRKRFTRGKIKVNVSPGELNLEGEVNAAAPQATTEKIPNAASRRPAVPPNGVSGNVQLGRSTISAPWYARIFRNVQIGRSRIEVTGEPGNPPKKPARHPKRKDTGT